MTELSTQEKLDIAVRALQNIYLYDDLAMQMRSTAGVALREINEEKE